MKQRKKHIFIISGVLLVLVALLGVAVWFHTRPEANIEVVTKDELDVEWYDEKQTEFTITTAEELFEFALLSSYYDFKGQTIKLGADIVVNEGDASEWGGITFPEKVWDKPIDSFAGTFDGQGHTISGIYCMGYLYKCSGKGLKPLPAGLFSNTKPECVIKNFRLVNSYFCGDLQDGAGTISACGGGTFDSIYSNATLVSYKYWNGGIIGKATESTKITNCWYDGKMEIIGGYARYTGGIMGRAMNKEADFLIEHCLVTGTMYNETEKTGVGMGAILGNALDSATVTINDCFVDAELTNEYNVAVGSVYGVSEQNAVVNLTHTYATVESHDRMVGAILGTANGKPVGFPQEMLKGYGGYQWTSLDFDKYWSVVENGTPILTTFADNTPSLEGVERYVDLSWYTDEATEYVLNDKADLYGFSLLTQSWDFKDKTVKLGADIVINDGKAADWAKEAPALEWISAGPKNKPFAGTFDGQMHTISGVYLDSEEMNTGLFSVAETGSVIKNLKLTNSYIKSGASFTGSIVGQGRGTIDTVYSDAIVVSSKGSVGGFVGLAYGKKVSMKNCWYDGTVTNTSNDMVERGTGGLIGTVYDDAGAKVESCLNTGTIDVKIYTYNQSKTGKNITPIAGGLVGWVRKPSSSLDMTDCLNTGKVLVSEKATGGYGSVMGYSDGVVTIAHTYASTESSALTAAKIDGWVLAFEEAKLTGYEGYRWTTLNFDKYWAAMEKGTPVLKSFGGKGISVSNVDTMVDTSWYDEKKDTYTLTDAADLYGFAYLANGVDFAGKTIVLGEDITLNGGTAAEWKNAAPSLLWNPIASKELPFAGTFDGKMHTISGIYVNANERNSGLFAATGEKSVIKNLKIANSYFTSTAGELGSVAGQGRGTFDTVYSEAIVVGNSANIGGLIGMGHGKDVKLEKCWFNGTVTNTANHKNNRGTGGLIGTLYDGAHAEIKGCLNSGIVDVTAYKFNQGTASKPNVTPIAGGIVGWVKTETSSVHMENCLSTKAVQVSDAVTGGYGAVLGYSENVKKTEIFATYSTVSPVAGSKLQGKIYEVSAADIAGYKGYQWTVLDFENYWAVVEGATPTLKPFASEIPEVAEEDRMIAVDWFFEATGTSEDPYKLSTKKDLYGLAMLSLDTEYEGFKGKTIVLDKNITLNKGDRSNWDEWTPIGSKALPFAGVFDGQMHTISGIYVDADTVNNGLFSVTDADSTIKNLKIKNSYFNSTKSALGSIVGQGRGLIHTVYSEAIVTSSTAQVGGLVGLSYGTKAKLEQCWFAGVVKNTATASNGRGSGGLVGVVFSNGATIMNDCLNSGIVDASASTQTVPKAGGFVGDVESKATLTTTDCLNVGTIKVASGKLGGIISGCINGGQVTVNTTYGYGVNCAVGYMQNSGKFIVNYILNGTAGTSDKSVNNNYVGNVPVITSFQTPANFIDETAATKLEGFDFANTWSVVPNSTPVLKAFVKEVYDTSWYDAEKDTYTLKDRGDLYGFAVLSQKNAFTGKKVQLGADIVVNVGDANTWGTVAPSFKWLPITPKNYAFAGTFTGLNEETGKIHTISGIYVNTTTANAGLFAVTGANSKVQNLKLTNSYFTSTVNSLGSIVGQGRGLIENVYSEAQVVGAHAQIGGLVGMAYGDKVVLNKCWFNGKVTNLAKNDTTANKNQRGTGGLIGILYSGGKVIMTDCLNSGEVDASASTQYATKAGGFIGNVESGSTLTITDCLNVGTVNVASGKLGGMFAGCIDGGTVISNTSYGKGNICTVGYMQNSAKFTVNYVLGGTAGTANKSVNNNYLGDVPVITSRRTFTGETAKTSLEGFDFSNTWATTESTPVLKTLAN